MKNSKSYKFWDRVSGWSKAETAANSTLTKCVDSKLGVHILPYDTVLDFGCGTGSISLQIAQYANKVHGVDVSEGMLRRAQQNLKDRNIQNATFQKIIALETMFAAESFQVVTSFNVFQYIENREELFLQFNKLLVPQGRLIIAIPCLRNASSFSALLVKLLRSVRIMPPIYSFSAIEIEKEITDSGFAIVESVTLSNFPEKFIVAKKVNGKKITAE